MLGRLYYQLHRALRGGPRAALARSLLQPKLLRSSPLPTAPGAAAHPAELHLLVCHADWLDGLWALRSFIAAHPHLIFPLALHDDGTLPPQAHEAFGKLFPSLRIITRAAADTALSAALAGHPRCLQLRSTNPFSLKLFDIPILASTPRVIVIDADILFFHPCTDLVDSAANLATPTRWNKDWRHGYTLTPEQLKPHINFPVVDLINSGLGTFVTASVDLDRIESWLAIPGITDHPYLGRVEQTLVALAACHHGFEFLPPPYDVHMSPRTSPAAPCRHYTGDVRPRLQAEGLPRLRHLLWPRPQISATKSLS